MHDVAKNISTETNVRRSRGGLGVAIGLLAAILIFVVGIKALQIGKMMSSPKMLPVTTVTSAAVKEEDWAPRLSAVGSVRASQVEVVFLEVGGADVDIRIENDAT